MYQVTAPNVNYALGYALKLLLDKGREYPSRNGPVLALDRPLITELVNPTHRVLQNPSRNANPTFHLMESLWMLAGRNDVAFPATFVKRMGSYSDDGKTFHGAYGYRWRNQFGYNQLKLIIEELRKTPDSRRCVLQMWDAMNLESVLGVPTLNIGDLRQAISGGKDVPCNTAIYFDMRDGYLNMTVSNRSNDMIWGLYGANAVHMSVLQEYVAFQVGAQVGWMYTLSNNAHVYLEQYSRPTMLSIITDAVHFTGARFVGDPQPMLLSNEDPKDFDEDLEDFFKVFDDHGITGPMNIQYHTDWFNFTVRRMLEAWYMRSHQESAHAMAATVASPDWSAAMLEWLPRA